MPVTALMMQCIRNGGAVAPVVAAPGVTPVNPISAFDWWWDADLSTLSVNANGTGGVPAIAANVGRVTNIGNNIDPTASNPLHFALDGTHSGPIKRSDGGSGFYLEHVAASHLALRAPASGNGTGTPTVPFTIMGIVQFPAENGTALFGPATTGANYRPSITSGSTADQIGFYNGGTELKVVATDNAWHAIAITVDTNDCDFFVDAIANLTTAANVGNNGFTTAMGMGWEEGDATTWSSAKWKCFGIKLALPTGYAGGDTSLLAGWLAYLNGRKPS